MAPKLEAFCPRLAAVELRGKSHFEMTEEEFETGRRLLRDAAVMALNRRKLIMGQD